MQLDEIELRVGKLYEGSTIAPLRRITKYEPTQKGRDRGTVEYEFVDRETRRIKIMERWAGDVTGGICAARAFIQWIRKEVVG